MMLLNIFRDQSHYIHYAQTVWWMLAHLLMVVMQMAFATCVHAVWFTNMYVNVDDTNFNT